MMNGRERGEKRHRGVLLVISGPSGVGKGTICRELKRIYPDVVYSVSATTRSPRPGEVNGRDYFFYTEEKFKDLIAKDAFLEWAKVFDNYYGTPKDFVDATLRRGQDCILEIDIQGALQVKKKESLGVFIFIMPPSKEELLRRIKGRGTEKAEQIKVRMNKVEWELEQADNYDYVVVNDMINTAAEEIKRIILEEKGRIAGDISCSAENTSC